MLYHPSDREIQRLPREIKRMLSVPALNVRETVPITTEKQARDYLSQKIGRYGDGKKIDVEVDKYIAKAMNQLLRALHMLTCMLRTLNSSPNPTWLQRLHITS